MYLFIHDIIIHSTNRYQVNEDARLNRIEEEENALTRLKNERLARLLADSERYLYIYIYIYAYMYMYIYICLDQIKK
jgi:hypothetical protein